MESSESEVFVNMDDVNKAVDLLCNEYGEHNRDRFTRILFLGVDAFYKEEMSK